MCIVAISEIPIIVEREKERNKKRTMAAAAAAAVGCGQCGRRGRDYRPLRALLHSLHCSILLQSVFLLQTYVPFLNSRF